MELTTKQEAGLKLAIERYKNKEKYTVISGYAGTGKSTLVKFIIAALGSCGIDPDVDVCYAAFTGKAAQVLMKKGNLNVSTLHKLLFEHIPKPNGGFFRKIKTTLDYKIVVVDEVSMAPKELMDLLFKHNVHVICLGDPFQLPPVSKDDDNHLLDKPHIFLDEIMRQAAESEIIRMTMDIRARKELKDYQGKDVIILPQSALNTGMLQWADQVIVATNATRVNVNNQMRELLGRGDKPEYGDKVICLKNEWNEFSNEGNPLVNGTIGFLKNTYVVDNRIPNYLLTADDPAIISTLMANFTSDSGEDYGELGLDNKMILTGEPALNWKLKYRLGKNEKTQWMVPKEFTYAYGITGHKSQGSEWPKVLLIEERFPFDRLEHARWMYTVATRAEEKLVIIRQNS